VKKSGFGGKILKAFHRSHFLNSLSKILLFDASVFVGFGEKFKKTEKADKRELAKLSLSLLHIINNFKSSSSQQNARIIQRKRGSKTTPHHHQNNNNFNFNFDNSY
jgi:hypothetical protein|tara:strand:+ start:445 stop:762 length:318 start_codon:yes stop_codon:yes gene_type:complete